MAVSKTPISNPLLQQIYNYLQTQPFGEVRQIVEGLERDLKEAEQNDTEADGFAQEGD